MDQLPLRVCNAITIYKTQGRTIGEGNPLPRMQATFPEETAKNIDPDLELVLFTRATGFQDIIIPNNDLTSMHLKKIGNGCKYDTRKQFELDIRENARNSKDAIVNEVTQYDTGDNKTFKGGCRRLMFNYRKRVDRVDVSFEVFCNALPPHWMNEEG